jgi:hypothetical protein
MTTDRELLGLAAKAAGYKIHKAHQSARDALIDPATASLWIDAVSTGWNPLKDDGHALRLAVKIPACIVIDNEMKWCGVHLHAERGKYEFVEHFDDDPAAATRRAIVRAAAEIGKAMP